ncbi:MAG: class I SAM-dependent methyltransferase [Pirellulales bacterium]
MNQYQLLDFGDGRKLERFGPWVLDRPCPAAVGVSKANLSQWNQATAQFTGERTTDGVWLRRDKRWQSDEVAVVVQEALPKALTFHLAPLPSGQVGLFPEQRANWQWIMEQTERAIHRAGRSLKGAGQSLKVLNLFAYTGGSTMATALMGAEVTHVDAAKSVVSRARENAKASSNQELQIRWIVEDAVKFCQREVRRGNKYDAVILDPPSYGHGPQGQAWSIQRGLLPLLNLCGQLTSDYRAFVLVTCHTPSIGPAELNAYLADGIFGHCGMPARTGTLNLESADGRQLPSGIYARWPG